MEGREITNVFRAYSHKDIDLISPIVRLLRVGWVWRLVFYDVDSITPGKKWREERDEALTHADLVLVFWCFHSSESDEVQYEYQAAISAKKDLLPLLLDATPLPADLREFQWIDFRNLTGFSHNRQQKQELRKTRVERRSGLRAVEDLDSDQLAMLETLDMEFSSRTGLPAPKSY